MSEISLAPEAADALPGLSKPTGLLRWIASVDHKQIGIMYIVGALVFFVIGGLEAMLIRTQLAQPNANIISPEFYNQLFTMHGVTMVFLVGMPILIGFGNYLVPLQIGAHDMAFPRLNALGLWLFVFGGLLMYFSFFIGQAPDQGWFSYTPLAVQPYTSHRGPDYWSLGLFVTGIGSVSGAINFIVTVWTMRAPGLTMRRLPLFTWMTFINGFLILFALQILNAGLVMLEVDRLFGGSWFTPPGSPVLWQHVFWSFGHPEVYILILPAFGMISEIIPVFSRKPIFGYEFVAGSTIVIGFLSFTVWAHHMFAVDLGIGWHAFQSAATMLISIPTGIKIFSWIATMWGGKLRLTTAMLFAVGFLVVFTIGGITGVTFALVPTDWQTTDTYYVVAHFHYVLVGGTFFAVYAGVYYWYPKVVGRMLSERLGKWHFWLNFAGLNLTFFVQHLLGLMGMPRRVYTYPDLPGWGTLNLISTLGGLVSALAVLVFVINLVWSARRGQPAGDNPWQGWTLEWATTSPPPPHNFDALPPVRSRRPLWDLAHPEDPDWKREH
ncbi:MAG TPA: cytochrome c oxidase subunit I [Herpetosiphonaceae bacterium]